MATLAFLDTETTGLDPDRHEVWEIGLILRTEDGTETEHQWQLPVDLARADPMALNIGRFHDRRHLDIVASNPEGWGVRLEATIMGQGDWVVPVDRLDYWARTFVDLTRGCHLVGAVISFDADRLWRLLRRLGECPMWHYHLVDVEAMAAGALQEPPPWDSEDLSEQVGCPVDKFDRHTALGDARWAMGVYDAVVNAPMEGEG